MIICSASSKRPSHNKAWKKLKFRNNAGSSCGRSLLAAYNAGTAAEVKHVANQLFGDASGSLQRPRKVATSHNVSTTCFNNHTCHFTILSPANPNWVGI